MSQKEKPDVANPRSSLATCHFLESLNLQHWTRIGAVFAREWDVDVDVGCWMLDVAGSWRDQGSTESLPTGNPRHRRQF